MNYNEALNLILSKQSLGIKPGLTRIKALLNSMGNPQNKIRIIPYTKRNLEPDNKFIILFNINNVSDIQIFLFEFSKER